jgi:hypothetical protein
VTSGQPSPANLTSAWDTVDLLVLTDLPARLDDQTLAVVEAIAALPAPPMVPVPEQRFNQCMRTLTCLPSREDDALTAKLRLALYRKHFGRYPEEAWSFLVERATLECRFFPTPSECKAILDRWSRTDGPWRAHQLAQRAASNERQARFDDLMARFRMGEVTQGEVDGLPERWKRIAAVQGYLREDGTFALRPVRGLTEQEGEAPADLHDQYTGPGEEAGQPHERTGP